MDEKQYRRSCLCREPTSKLNLTPSPVQSPSFGSLDEQARHCSEPHSFAALLQRQHGGLGSNLKRAGKRIPGMRNGTRCVFLLAVFHTCSWCFVLAQADTYTNFTSGTYSKACKGPNGCYNTIKLYEMKPDWQDKTTAGLIICAVLIGPASSHSDDVSM